MTPHTLPHRTGAFSGMAGNYRLLLVEDESHDAAFIQRMLAEWPSARFEVEHCTRLAEALERLTETTFDVVLLDLSLPDSQGLPTFEAVQQHAPGMPIVVLSGFDDEDVALDAVKLGAQGLSRQAIGQRQHDDPRSALRDRTASGQTDVAAARRALTPAL